MSKVYGLMADVHLHAWSAFSTVLPNSVNSRLSGLLGEVKRCVEETVAAGGNKVVIAGDVFHVRGSVSPSVLNPTIDLLRSLGDSHGVDFVILAGNHDLEQKEATRLGSAITALEGPHVTVCNQIHVDRDIGVILVPWIESIDSLKEELTALTKLDAINHADYDLILHAPIDGVIKGLPHHGLSPEWLAELGFKRVASGHYHNHKAFDGGVYSIGALAHHTWSDVGSRAGFLLVHDDRVEFRKSHLPEFIDLSQLVDLDPDEELPFLVDGNFIRVKVESSKVKDVEAARKELLDMGAKAVLVQAQPKPTERTSTTGAVSVSGSSLEVSVTDFVRAMHPADPVAFDAIVKASLDVLASVDSSGE